MDTIKNDSVTIITYGQEQVMPRQKAIKFYKQAVQCCEGSERERYTNILMDLLDNKTICIDC